MRLQTSRDGFYYIKVHPARILKTVSLEQVECEFSLEHAITEVRIPEHDPVIVPILDRFKLLENTSNIVSTSDDAMILKISHGNPVERGTLDSEGDIVGIEII